MMFDSAHLTHGVDVIIPVYGNLRVVRRCIESVLAFRKSVGRVLVVDDASPDAETAVYLDRMQATGAIEVLRHAVNQGVVAAANTGFTASTRDVVLLNSDTEVHGDWAARLLRCAYSADDIGTVTPFTNDATVCSYPFIAWYRGIPGGLTLAEIDGIFANENGGACADIPSGVSFCLFIRRTCLDTLGLFDLETFGRGYGEETDFCQRVALAGWRNVVCADTFVYHETGGSFGPARQARADAADRILEARYPGYSHRVREFILRDSLQPFRHRVDIARARRSPDQAHAVLDERAAEKAWAMEWVASLPPAADHPATDRSPSDGTAHEAGGPLPDVDIVLPVHNEAATIRETLQEWWAALRPHVRLRFIVCEDGSTDGTQDVLRACAAEFPMKLIIGEERKGYSRAVRDGFGATEAPYVLAIDSDGQCDPADFEAFWNRRAASDVVLGWRVERADPTVRRIFSRGFRAWYRLLLDAPYRDPSCPYLLIQRRVLDRLLPELGVLEQGFWWEFVARVHRRGFRIVELPVRHRRRKAGQTQVYRWNRMASIGIAHALGLFTIRRQTRRVS